MQRNDSGVGRSRAAAFHPTWVGNLKPAARQLLPLSRDLAYDIFSNFAEQTAQAIFIVDLKPVKILYINPAAQELWDVGNQSETADLQHLIRMVHEEDREHALEKINDYLTGHELNSVEFRITSKDPDQWVCLTLHSREDERGKKLQLLVIAENITRRKEYELYLFRHNAKKNSILNNVV